jgi:hypothetical protein
MRSIPSPSDKPKPERIEQGIVDPKTSAKFLLGSHEPGRRKSLSIRFYPLDIANFDVRIHHDQVDDKTVWLNVQNRSDQDIYVIATVLGGSNADTPAA